MGGLMNKTVLLADDEEFILNLLEISLSRLGMNVIKAADGIEALEQYTAHRDSIDAVILDMNMPRKNGIEVLHELRSQDADIPIWLSSGSPDEDFVDGSVREMLTGLFHKPFTLKDLEQELKSRLGG